MEFSSFLRINAKLFYTINNSPPLECLARMECVFRLVNKLTLPIQNKRASFNIVFNSSIITTKYFL